MLWRDPSQNYHFPGISLSVNRELVVIDSRTCLTLSIGVLPVPKGPELTALEPHEIDRLSRSLGLSGAGLQHRNGDHLHQGIENSQADNGLVTSNAHLRADLERNRCRRAQRIG